MARFTLVAHIVTVGTSVLTNARKSMGREEPSEEELLSFVSQDPRRASAELNTLLPTLESRRDKQHRVYFLHSDTKEGKLCAEVLKRFLSGLEMRVAAETIEIKDLGDPKNFRNGLANLLEKIIRIAKRHYGEGDAVLIHATGGFKPETAIALLAANFPKTGAPVLYIHEAFKEVVRLPALPVSLRKREKFADLMEHMARVKRAHTLQLEREFGREVVGEAERLGWIDREGEYFDVTPMGELIWKKFARLGLLREGA